MTQNKAVGDAAEFAVAEQCRRRHWNVAIPIGDPKQCDILVSNQFGESATIEVKGTQQNTPNPTWSIKDVDERWKGFWVLVQYRDEQFDDHHPIGKYEPKRPHFFVLTNAEIFEIYKSNIGHDGGVRYNKSWDRKYLERWNKILPSDEPDGVLGKSPAQRRNSEQQKIAAQQGWEKTRKITRTPKKGHLRRGYTNEDERRMALREAGKIRRKLSKAS